ncbi:hypothetical protein [Alicyclobacillus sp. SO9]|uniref:hypothetical protein n=1 Tax=Alicyclobacillus sp. SO9 TaxID=2665646 RepID=UPI0018E8620B|nr:hypothetical protein [Alicyclobacillus sp. SO9]QQE77286.1 hypothetical protein GI364_15105 [Alicyclobacillus sp. SO9]
MHKDALHRLAKQAMDSGRVSSVEQAMGLLRSLHLNVYVGPEIEDSRSLQAALATIINTGRRTFVGGVHVVASEDYTVDIPWSQSTSLSGLARKFGANWLSSAKESAPSIILGGVQSEGLVGSRKIQVTFDGWTASVTPWRRGRLPERDTYPVAGVLAGAMAVSEAFLSQWTRNALAGERKLEVCLWPHIGDQIEPPTALLLPAKLWIVGLGHLGQAVLWTLGLLPYKHPDEVSFVLQDFDKISESNDSTCLLTDSQGFDKKKSRWIAERCEEVGFQTTICERLFSEETSPQGDEPELCLCLPDNMAAREALATGRFRYSIEAGLGDSHETFMQFGVHTFPGVIDPTSLGGDNRHKSIEVNSLPPAYQVLGDKVEACGLVELAGVAVGAPFVGTVAACFVVSELVRLLNGGPLFDIIQGDLRNLDDITFVEKRKVPTPYNYGFVESIS